MFIQSGVAQISCNKRSLRSASKSELGYYTWERLQNYVMPRKIQMAQDNILLPIKVTIKIICWKLLLDPGAVASLFVNYCF